MKAYIALAGCEIAVFDRDGHIGSIHAKRDAVHTPRRRVRHTKQATLQGHPVCGVRVVRVRSRSGTGGDPTWSTKQHVSSVYVSDQNQNKYKYQATSSREGARDTQSPYRTTEVQRLEPFLTHSIPSPQSGPLYHLEDDSLHQAKS